MLRSSVACPRTGDVCLSLSGGYDSTAVLGALRMLDVPDVRCYTYRKTTEGSRSDASVARQMAAIAGYEYTEIEAYRDDVATVSQMRTFAGDTGSRAWSWRPMLGGH